MATSRALLKDTLNVKQSNYVSRILKAGCFGTLSLLIIHITELVAEVVANALLNIVLVKTPSRPPLKNYRAK